jgi:signal peptidase I
MMEKLENDVQTDGQQNPDTVLESTDKTRPGNPKGVIHSWIRDLVVSVAVSAFIIIFLYQPCEGGGNQHASGIGRSGPVVHQ